MAFRLVQDNLRAAVLKMVRPSMDALGSAIVEKARELAPIDTGQLRDSIGFTYRQNTGELQIHCDVFYCLYQEFGTKHIPAHPFLRPALMAAPDLWKTATSVKFQTQIQASPSGVFKVPSEARADERFNIREL
jgi:HK97 gp10 family phage protein